MRDAFRVVRAVATNQLARVAPGAYVRLTGQTGRGDSGSETAQSIADYFVDCVADYAARLGVQDIGEIVRDRTMLEYGPGDLPGVALLMVAKGARRVLCVDRFPLVSLDARSVAVIQRLLERCSPPERERMRSCMRDPDDISQGFRSDRIEYRVLRDGLSALESEVDMVYSRAVLEHVNDLTATFDDMILALRPGGLAIHQVDLSSHGLHRDNPLDFLTWRMPVWNAMYSAKGVPNRWRVDRYRELLDRPGIEVQQIEATRRAEPAHVTAVRPRLAPEFRDTPDEDLAWLGFWVVFRKLTD